jgi:hypothetical protein
VSVLMESVPSGVELQELERTIRATPGDFAMGLHAPTISDGFDAVTVHVVLDGTAHDRCRSRRWRTRPRRAQSLRRWFSLKPPAPSSCTAVASSSATGGCDCGRFIFEVGGRKAFSARGVRPIELRDHSSCPAAERLFDSTAKGVLSDVNPEPPTRRSRARPRRRTSSGSA